MPPCRARPTPAAALAPPGVFSASLAAALGARSRQACEPARPARSMRPPGRPRLAHRRHLRQRGEAAVGSLTSARLSWPAAARQHRAEVSKRPSISPARSAVSAASEPLGTISVDATGAHMVRAPPTGAACCHGDEYRWSACPGGPALASASHVAHALQPGIPWFPSRSGFRQDPSASGDPFLPFLPFHPSSCPFLPLQLSFVPSGTFRRPSPFRQIHSSGLTPVFRAPLCLAAFTGQPTGLRPDAAATADQDRGSSRHVLRRDGWLIKPCGMRSIKPEIHDAAYGLPTVALSADPHWSATATITALGRRHRETTVASSSTAGHQTSGCRAQHCNCSTAEAAAPSTNTPPPSDGRRLVLQLMTPAVLPPAMQTLLPPDL